MPDKTSSEYEERVTYIRFLEMAEKLKVFKLYDYSVEYSKRRMGKTGN
jgi:hypothetical protein